MDSSELPPSRELDPNWKNSYFALFKLIMEGPIGLRDASVIVRLQKKLGVPDETVRVQQLILFVEAQGQMDALLTYLGISGQSSLVDRLLSLSSRDLALASLHVGFTPDEMLKSEPYIQAFLSMFHGPEGLAQLNRVLLEVAGDYQVLPPGGTVAYVRDIVASFQE